MRIGEAAALRWRAYDPSLNLLGRLLIASSYNRKRKLEKAVKTERPREVPVHPTLAKMLAPWKLGGWKRLMGRQPTPDDLLIPSFERKHLLDPQVLERFHQDLQALGFRPRRTHDARRTFVSLSLADGARRDILRWITHGPEGDIVSLYTSLPWAALCEEVTKLNIGLRAGQLLELRKASNSSGDPSGSGGGLLQSLLQTRRVNPEASTSRGLRLSCASAQGGTRTQFEAKKTFVRSCGYPTSPRPHKSFHPAPSESVPPLPSPNRAGGQHWGSKKVPRRPLREGSVPHRAPEPFPISACPIVVEPALLHAAPRMTS